MTVPDPSDAVTAEQRALSHALQAQTRITAAPDPGPSPMDHQLIGRTLLGCQIQSVIGHGAAGTVFLARHLQIDCLRAIKVLKSHLASNATTVERFRSEARSAARIRHENLVTLHNADEGEGYFAYVMEYVEGQTLAQLVNSSGPLEPYEAVELLGQVCAGLSAAHQAGITHRDIKPENLLLTPNGQIKVADFGLARTVDSQHLTQQDQAVGTPPYMSPEQCMSQPIDPRSDLYSLGLVAYYLLTGVEPMFGDSPMATMFNQVNLQPDPPHILRPAIGAALSGVICRMLAKNPADRQQTAETVSEELQAALGDAQPSTDRVLPPTTTIVQVTPPSTPAVGAGVARRFGGHIVMLLVGLLAGWFVGTQQTEAPLPDLPTQKRTTPVQLDLIPEYIQAIARDDQPAAFEVLARHLAQHPRDWEHRSKRIEHARQLNRILEAVPDLQALDQAGKLSELETEMLMGIYLKQEQQQQASKLMQRVMQRNPRFAVRLSMEQARQQLDASKPFEAARTWLQTPSGTDPGGVFLRTLEQQLRDSLAKPKRKLPADLDKLLVDLFTRDPRFFNWPYLADWFAADPRRVKPLGMKLLMLVLDSSCHDRKWEAVAIATGKQMQAKHWHRAMEIGKKGGMLAVAAYRKKDFVLAVRLMNRFLCLVPKEKSIQLLWLRGAAYLELDQQDRALVDFNKVLRTRPLDRHALSNRAIILAGREQYEQAIRDSTAAIMQSSRDKINLDLLHLTRGVAYLLANKPSEARTDFERSIKIKPLPLTSLCLALARADTGESAAARTTLAKLLSLGTGRVLLGTDGHRAFIEIGARLIKLLPEHPLAHAERGNIHLKLRDRAAASRDLKRALELCTGKYAPQASRIEKWLSKAQALPGKDKE